MADTEKKFSELTAAAVLTDADILAISQIDSATASLMSKRTTLIAIANKLASLTNYTSELTTQDKTLTGAINELKGLISLIPHFGIEVVQTLPVEDISETTIYMTPSQNPQTQDAYDEFIYVNNSWEHVGSTAVDLSAYYTKLEVDGLLATKANSADVAAALATKENTADLDDDVTDIIVDLTDTQTTAAGNPVTFTTAQEGGAKSALVTFTPKQSGTGDPSPSNIRPISGWDSLELTRTGKNLLNQNTMVEGYVSAGGIIVDPSPTALELASDYILISPNTDYVFSVSVNNNYAKWIGTGFYDLNKNFIERVTLSPSLITDLVQTLHTPNNAMYMRVSYRGYGISQNPQVELGSTATAYEPYQTPTEYTATFPETEYGGSYDFVSGEGSNEWGYIASYNGETLPSEWMSDRDVYEPNTTPTTGAEVAYKLATPTEISLTPANVELNKGTNVVSTDGDTVQVKYSELPQGNLGAVIDYIQKLEARVAALEGNGNRSLSLMKSAPIETKEEEPTEENGEEIQEEPKEETKNEK